MANVLRNTALTKPSLVIRKVKQKVESAGKMYLISLNGESAHEGLSGKVQNVHKTVTNTVVSQ